jgi:Holliday junction resolvase
MTKSIKKRINSKRKGNMAERELARILSERFGVPFARVGVSSGARVKNTKLPDSAVEVMTGDLITPARFRFSVECKSVNAHVDFLAPSALLDKFLTQAEADAKSIQKVPMLCWKRNRKGWIASVPFQVFRFTNVVLPAYYAVYQDWLVCRLDTLLAVQNLCFWFEETLES